MKRLLVLAALALLTAAPVDAHTTTASWTAFETEQRLTVGRFAATHGIKYATCLGTGAAVNPKASAFSRRYRHLECSVQNRALTVERQLVVHVRTATSFTPQWLTVKECG
jgi:hypothetical protein